MQAAPVPRKRAMGRRRGHGRRRARMRLSWPAAARGTAAVPRGGAGRPVAVLRGEPRNAEVAGGGPARRGGATRSRPVVARETRRHGGPRGGGARQGQPAVRRGEGAGRSGNGAGAEVWVGAAVADGFWQRNEEGDGGVADSGPTTTVSNRLEHRLYPPTSILGSKQKMRIDPFLLTNHWMGRFHSKNQG